MPMLVVALTFLVVNTDAAIGYRLVVMADFLFQRHFVHALILVVCLMYHADLVMLSICQKKE